MISSSAAKLALSLRLLRPLAVAENEVQVVQRHGATAAAAGSTPADPFQDKLREKTEQELLRMMAQHAAQQPPVASQHQGAAVNEGEKEDEQEDEATFINPETGEVYGPKGKEPTRYGDWENKGRCTDF